MYTYTLAFLGSTLYSIVLETLVVIVFFRLFWKNPSLSLRTLTGVATLATFATIPYVWFVFPVLGYQSSLLALILGEVFAVVVESLIYKQLLCIPLSRSVLLSVSANTVSYFSASLIDLSRFFL